jgi:hypothetical protein
MGQPADLAAVPRCGAWGRAQRPCRLPAMRGKKRCFLHGGRNPAPPRGRSYSLVHGRYSAATIEAKRQARAATRAAKARVEQAIDEVMAVARPAARAARRKARANATR